MVTGSLGDVGACGFRREILAAAKRLGWRPAPGQKPRAGPKGRTKRKNEVLMRPARVEWQLPGLGA